MVPQVPRQISLGHLEFPHNSWENGLAPDPALPLPRVYGMIDTGTVAIQAAGHHPGTDTKIAAESTAESTAESAAENIAESTTETIGTIGGTVWMTGKM